MSLHHEYADFSKIINGPLPKSVEDPRSRYTRSLKHVALTVCVCGQLDLSRVRITEGKGRKNSYSRESKNGIAQVYKKNKKTDIHFLPQSCQKRYLQRLKSHNVRLCSLPTVRRRIDDGQLFVRNLVRRYDTQWRYPPIARSSRSEISDGDGHRCRGERIIRMTRANLLSRFAVPPTRGVDKGRACFNKVLFF